MFIISLMGSGVPCGKIMAQFPRSVLYNTAFIPGIGKAQETLYIMEEDKVMQLISELEASNKLLSVSILLDVQEKMRRKEFVELKEQLACIDQTYTYPNIEDENLPIEELEKERKKMSVLSDYLAVMELHAYLFNNGYFPFSMLETFAGDLYRDLRDHPQICRQILEEETFYPNLNRVFDKLG